MNIREEAIDSLLNITQQGAFSNLEIQTLYKDRSIKEEDKNLYVNLIYGTLQNQTYLDYLMEPYTRGEHHLHASVRMILRVTLYQLQFLEKVPTYAAVNEAVNITGKFQPKAKRFVNGVLRNFLRNPARSCEVKDFDNEKAMLSVRYSIPLWIIYKYYETFGKEQAEAIIPLLNERPPLTLRVNTLKISRPQLMEKLIDMDPQESPLSSDGILLGHGFKNGIQNNALYKAGYFTIQDQAAILVADMLDAKPGDCVLDLCAAPGGKTTHLAQMMQNQGQIIARDLYPQRVTLIERNAARLGVEIIETQAADGTLFKAEEVEKYDRILLDVPCTGLGIIRRKPEIRYHSTKQERKAIRGIQQKLIENAIAYLKKGGTLVYSTCTVAKEENSGQIDWLLAHFKTVKKVEEKITSPLMAGADGFYICKLIKE